MPCARKGREMDSPVRQRLCAGDSGGGHSVWKADELHFKFGPRWALGGQSARNI